MISYCLIWCFFFKAREVFRNTRTCFLEKEKRYNTETFSIDTVLNKEHFMEKSCRKCAPKASPRLLFNFDK